MSIENLGVNANVDNLKQGAIETKNVSKQTPKTMLSSKELENKYGEHFKNKALPFNPKKPLPSLPEKKNVNELNTQNLNPRNSIKEKATGALGLCLKALGYPGQLLSKEAAKVHTKAHTKTVNELEIDRDNIQTEKNTLQNILTEFENEINEFKKVKSEDIKEGRWTPSDTFGGYHELDDEIQKHQTVIDAYKRNITELTDKENSIQKTIDALPKQGNAEKIFSFAYVTGCKALAQATKTK